MMTATQLAAAETLHEILVSRPGKEYSEISLRQLFVEFDCDPFHFEPAVIFLLLQGLAESTVVEAFGFKGSYVAGLRAA